MGGIGIASAANGGSLVLGSSNTATHTTSLKDSKGTPLALIAKKGKPPLTVNSGQLVKHLNAAEVGGLTPSKLSVGSSAQRNWNIGALIGGSGNVPVLVLPFATEAGSTTVYHPQSVASTGKLAKGTYFVAATILGTAPDGIICFATVKPTFPTASQFALVSESFPTGSLDSTVTLTKPGRIHLWCLNADSDATDDPGEVVTDYLSALHVAKRIAGTTTPPNGTSSTLIRRLTR
ncbi:MAG TPA: hypothetical protein VHV79_01430 [Mycobacteriales bacterium]|nr:hypothetical protein [Mycobacteriales bacterium]